MYCGSDERLLWLTFMPALLRDNTDTVRSLEYYPSPIGLLLLSFDGQCVTDISFTDKLLSAPPLYQKENLKKSEIFIETKNYLDLYFSGKIPPRIPPLRPACTDFVKTVLEITLTIPYGKTATYGEIARAVTAGSGLKKMAAQAVGHALAQNPIPIIIPCHRVIGVNGKLTGYTGGIERKRKLLALEAAQAGSLQPFDSTR